ncbi:hypothetical protein QBC37DRAFT_285682 [Rhypophila decipiens]|uniref:Uncharacterized protein n=1 Tax=Rhypophila decipiens TaxID=261697 RepID=A0AAN7BA24_9PEZI|nr:hypothetical protein QBC37DRAFT_285682 [Rhypophila decipiens]
MEKYGYDKVMEAMCSSDPRLQKSVLHLLPPPPGTWVPWARARTRVLALQLGLNGLFAEPVEYTSAPTLAADLEKTSASAGEPSRCVYLLEGLSPEFVSLLGTHFHLHPSLFMDHERLVPHGGRLKSDSSEAGGVPYLPSTILGRDHISLKYHEPLVLGTRPTGFRNLCDTSGRHIAVTRLMDQFSDVVVSRRKCTFWSKDTESGGWTCLIICDPPIRRIIDDYSGRSGTDVVTSPYGSGYPDFMALSNQIQAWRGPPRSCLLDDVLFYLQNHCGPLGDITSAKTLRVFVNKIVASHFLKLAEFLQANIDKVQWHLSRRQDLASFDVSMSEGLWSDVQSWQRRIAEYQDDIGGIMLQMGIPPDGLPDSDQARDWTDSHADFQHLLCRYREIGRRTQALSDAISSLGGLAGNRAAARSAELLVEQAEQAARENRSVKTLTALGMVFLPMSLASSLLSMSDYYLPGNSLFWVYFAISCPMVGFVLLLYFAVEIRPTAAQGWWSSLVKRTPAEMIEA